MVSMPVSEETSGILVLYRGGTAGMELDQLGSLQQFPRQQILQDFLSGMENQS